MSMPAPTVEMPKLIGLEKFRAPIVLKKEDGSAELCGTVAIGEDATLWGLWYEYTPPPSWREITGPVGAPRGLAKIEIGFWRQIADFPRRLPETAR